MIKRYKLIKKFIFDNIKVKREKRKYHQIESLSEDLLPNTPPDEQAVRLSDLVERLKEMKIQFLSGDRRYVIDLVLSELDQSIRVPKSV